MEQLTSAATKWTFTQKVFFRFFFVYFILYCFPFPLDAIEFTQPITKPFYDLLEWFILKTSFGENNWQANGPVYCGIKKCF